MTGMIRTMSCKWWLKSSGTKSTRNGERKSTASESFQKAAKIRSDMLCAGETPKVLQKIPPLPLSTNIEVITALRGLCCGRLANQLAEWMSFLRSTPKPTGGHMDKLTDMHFVALARFTAAIATFWSRTEMVSTNQSILVKWNISAWRT